VANSTKSKRPKLVTVVWADHHDSDNAWDTPGQEPGTALFESRGWLIFENDEIVELSNTRPRNNVGGLDLWGRPLRIAKVGIVSRSDMKAQPEAGVNRES